MRFVTICDQQLFRMRGEQWMESIRPKRMPPHSKQFVIVPVPACLLCSVNLGGVHGFERWP